MNISSYFILFYPLEKVIIHVNVVSYLYITDCKHKGKAKPSSSAQTQSWKWMSKLSFRFKNNPSLPSLPHFPPLLIRSVTISGLKVCRVLCKDPFYVIMKATQWVFLGKYPVLKNTCSKYILCPIGGIIIISYLPKENRGTASRRQGATIILFIQVWSTNLGPPLLCWDHHLNHNKVLSSGQVQKGHHTTWFFFLSLYIH